MTKEEFADIMINELQEWGKFISLDDELPWTIDEEKMFEVLRFIGYLND